jgi:hypothetical protein
VQGAVGRPVTATVEAVPLGLPRGRRQQGGAAQHREARLAGDPAGTVAGGDQQLAGDLYADPGGLEQPGSELTDERFDEGYPA